MLRIDQMSKSTQDQTLRSPEEDSLFERRGRRLTMHRRLFFFGEGEFEGEATVLDISTNGCKATSHTEVKVGSSLKLSLFLQDQQWPLRIDHALGRWGEGKCFGLEFIGIRPAHREWLGFILMKVNL